MKERVVNLQTDREGKPQHLLTVGKGQALKIHCGNGKADKRFRRYVNVNIARVPCVECQEKIQQLLDFWKHDAEAHPEENE